MSDDGSAQSNAVWPLPRFSFLVNWGSVGKASFQEVSGLESETQVVEFRHGHSPVSSPIKMPGIAKVGNVTLKRGVFVGGDAFWNWYNAIKLNTVKRMTVVIELLDESGRPTVTWTLNNAWPTKITGSDLKSDGNEVAVETIEIAHEGVTIKNG